VHQYKWTLVRGITIDDEKFGRSLTYEDLAERGSAGSDIEHVNNIQRVVQKISGIFYSESDRSKMISKICDYLLETRGYLNARIFTVDAASISFKDLRHHQLGRVDEFSRNPSSHFRRS